MRKGRNLMQKKLPIGIENFEDMIKENYYYVDKTGLIKQLLNEHGLVNLFTRTRRFGKSLNMSMLKYFFEIFEQTKKWYDGYRFGNTDIYCPWDVINHCRALKIEPDATPQSYWINTSGNYIVKRFIEKANQQTRREIEQLIEGKAIQKEIRLELTYNELDSTMENLWSVLFATGYLTQQGKPQGRTYSLIIPNESIRQIFIEQIQEWFKETTRKDENRLKDFCKACKKALKQIKEKHYDQKLEEEGYETILNYGIACYKKRCKVMVDK